VRRDLRAHFVDFVADKELCKPGERVLVAVSGGVDSMVLLDLFRAGASQLGVTLAAAHFDHAMRTDSAADADWVAEICEAWSIELVRGRAHQQLAGEASARAARYAFLTEAAQRVGAQRIATAHHADDQIETVLLRLLRGTGLRGLSGIPLRRGIIIRPLLRFRKTELIAYAASHSIPFREDETNATDLYARNQIRRALLPVLTGVRPDSQRAILRLARHAASTEKCWRSLSGAAAERVILQRNNTASELARGKLLEYDGEVRARVIRGELRRIGIVPTFQATQRLLRFIESAESGSRIDVGNHVRVERAYDVIRIVRPAPAPDDRPVVIEKCADGKQRARIGAREVDVSWSTRADRKSGEQFDCTRLAFPLQLRAWQAGDRMRLAYGTKKLKKLFAEARVPIHERDSVPVLVDANGAVYWAVGIARSVDAQANEQNPALTITVSHA
jgi:tRNA(Ile)-lysidine synthase